MNINSSVNSSLNRQFSSWNAYFYSSKTFNPKRNAFFNLACIGVLFWMAGATWAQCENLFFSEAAEGSSNNKYLEIYNPTGSDVDLSGYAFPNVSNAPSVVGEYEFWNTFPAGAMVAAGDVYIIAHPSQIRRFWRRQTTRLPSSQTATTVSFWFKATRRRLFKLTRSAIGTAIQVQAGRGRCVANGTQNHTIVRKSSVLVRQTVVTGSPVQAPCGKQRVDCPGSKRLDQFGDAHVRWMWTSGLGCTNANATNYNADATQDDGSCMFDNACNVDGVVVEASSFQYNPANLSIEPGQTVVWSNLGGTHDVNGDIDSQTGSSFGNPEAFYFGSCCWVMLPACALARTPSTHPVCTPTIAPSALTLLWAWWPPSRWAQAVAPTRLQPTTTPRQITTTVHA